MLRLVRRELDRLVEQRLVLDDATDLDAAGRGHDDLGFRVLDPRRELGCREAAEHDRVDRAEPRAGEHRDDGLGDHRQVDDDPVALLDAERAQRAGEAGHGVEQLGVGVGPLRLRDRAVVDQRDALAVAGGDVAVQRVLAGVELARRGTIGRTAPASRRGPRSAPAPTSRGPLPPARTARAREGSARTSHGSHPSRHPHRETARGQPTRPRTSSGLSPLTSLPALVDPWDEEYPDRPAQCPRCAAASRSPSTTSAPDYSALTTLRSLPAQIVKIDKSFVAGSTTNPEDRAVTEAVVQMAAQMGMRTIAEGVETARPAGASCESDRRGRGAGLTSTSRPPERRGLRPLGSPRISATRGAEATTTSWSRSRHGTRPDTVHIVGPAASMSDSGESPRPGALSLPALHEQHLHDPIERLVDGFLGVAAAAGLEPDAAHVLDRQLLRLDRVAVVRPLSLASTRSTNSSTSSRS